MSIALYIFFVSAGMFSIFCALKDYDFFINNSKAWLFVKIFGRNGARVFYVLLGIFLIAASTYMFLNASRTFM